MNIHRSRTEDRADPRSPDEQETPAATGGPTATQPERPATPPPVPGRSADTASGTTSGTAGRTVTPPVPPQQPAAAPTATPVAAGERSEAASREPRVGGLTKATPPAADEIDRLSRRMERAVGGFVDDPRRAVREADAILDEATRRLAQILEERRNTLRDSWRGDNGAKTGTEELRVALTKYRDMTRHLLNVG